MAEVAELDDDAQACKGQTLQGSIKRPWNRRLWRPLARAPEAVAGIPVAGTHHAGSAELHGAHQARPEEVQEPSWGTAKGVVTSNHAARQAKQFLASTSPVAYRLSCNRT